MTYVRHLRIFCMVRNQGKMEREKAEAEKSRRKFDDLSGESSKRRSGGNDL